MSATTSAAVVETTGASLHTEGSVEAPADGRLDSSVHSYLQRYPESGRHWEVGGFVGAVVISDKNAFRGPVARTPPGDILGPYSNYRQPTFELGVRAAYLLLPFLGGELEGFVAQAPADAGGSASLYGARGHVLVQAPNWSVTPFLIAGAGYWWVDSDDSGRDGEPAFHLGAGGKAALSESWSVRLDLRDNITSERSGEGLPHHFEALAGATYEFGARRLDTPPLEQPTRLASHAHPPAAAPSVETAPLDADGDNIRDDVDQCPTLAGAAPTGCPSSEPGLEGHPGGADGEAPSIIAQTCPAPDADAGREIFAGVEAIEFPSEQDDVPRGSRPTLDYVAVVMLKERELRLEIVGHTDDRGSREFNDALSQRRAEAVRRYLVDRGVSECRLRVRGAGPAEPLAPNDSAAARQRNRRIEFHVVQ